ncbi:ferric reductase-like transmembrane domain-containing protein [Halarcobacter sp.]|uniref:sulfite oxidase heme-binding subunit YedZ n=1 Tax=Halarcobacter sp. TaxID=2321133 RepID=UPI0029F56BDA|nr:ferric reductase-like transmembrane domain-containing protein [Halarcobacter sp.]
MKKGILTFLLFLPFFFIVYEVFIIKNVIDPIKYIYTYTGISATVLLFVTVSLSLIKKWINLIKYRKIVGLMGFFYALLHFLNFIIFDAQGDFSFIINESFDKPFIYLGVIAFFILLFMAITSTKRLFKNYVRYHKLVYISLILITIHFTMAQKSFVLIDLLFIIIILIIGYFKLLQYIIKKNNF